jgi:hypothetical protein
VVRSSEANVQMAKLPNLVSSSTTLLPEGTYTASLHPQLLPPPSLSLNPPRLNHHTVALTLNPTLPRVTMTKPRSDLPVSEVDSVIPKPLLRLSRTRTSTRMVDSSVSDNKTLNQLVNKLLPLMMDSNQPLLRVV